ncbi:MAG: PadR family transcriptional regulator [Leucobacter sp.]
MPYKYAIPGYLSSGEGSGYYLVRQLDGGLGAFWAASRSQVYSELKRLGGADLISGTATTVVGRLEMRVRSLTPGGASCLQTWTNRKPEYRRNRDPERLQLISSDSSSMGMIQRHFEAHLEHCTIRRSRAFDLPDQILTGRHPRIQQLLEGKSNSERAVTRLARDLTYSGDLQRAEFEIAGAAEALARLDEYSPTKKAPGTADAKPKE